MVRINAVNRGADTETARHINKALTNTGEISDGFHTFDELYDHRALFYACLLGSNLDISWKTMSIGGGPDMPETFAAGLNIPDYGPVAIILQNKYYGLFEYVRRIERTPPDTRCGSPEALAALNDFFIEGAGKGAPDAMFCAIY